MNILVTGSNGQLGKSIKNITKTHNHHNNYIFSDVNDLDLTDLEKVKSYILENNIEMVINCAAYTDVEKAATDEWINIASINILAVRNLAEIMKEVDGVLIHISSDYVYGSKYNTPISEDSKPYPESIYGISKQVGDAHVINSGCKYLIFRTSWLYSAYGKNFVKTMLDLTSRLETVKVVFDQVGTPTYAHDLAMSIFNIIESEKYENAWGLYHYSNEGVCSWYDFAYSINKYSGHNCNVVPCHSDEFPSSVNRPSYSVMDKTKFKKTFGIKIPYWTESLKKCLNYL